MADVCLCTESLIQSLMWSVGVSSIANVNELMFFKLLFLSLVIFVLPVVLVNLFFFKL